MPVSETPTTVQLYIIDGSKCSFTKTLDTFVEVPLQVTRYICCGNSSDSLFQERFTQLRLISLMENWSGLSGKCMYV